MKTKIKALVGACALLTGVGVTSATAASAAGPPVERFDGIYANCTGMDDVFIITLGAHANLTPGFILDSNIVLVPFAIRYTETFTPTGGEPDVHEMVSTRAEPKNAPVTTCTATGSFTEPEGTYTIDVLVKAAVRGA